MTHKSCITVRTLNYGNSGIFLIIGDAGYIMDRRTEELRFSA